MSLIVSNLRAPFGCADEAVFASARALCHAQSGEVLSASIYKKSYDLRHGRLTSVCSVELHTVDDDALCARAANPQVRIRKSFPALTATGTQTSAHAPVVVGLGPAGLFAALVLAEHGYAPVVIERGAPMESRDAAVSCFFSGGALDENSNVQFGEGGAGAYSDGKLTTRINDPRCEQVLETLIRLGAPAQTAHTAKPHIGTDLLKGIVVAIRNRILELGGTIHFQTAMQGLCVRTGVLHAVKTELGELPCECAVLAVGHSARDTFEQLYTDGVAMEQKPFSVGVRAEHLQADINAALYGKHAGMPGLPPGEYALSHRVGARACYTFCMCPGGEVVAAASERDGVVVNGMSYHARAGKNANSAVVVSVAPGDYGSDHPLAGVTYQRTLEERAFALGGGGYLAPAQQLGDFAAGRPSTGCGRVEPTYARGVRYTDLNALLPHFASSLIAESMCEFSKKLRPFGFADTLFTGVETRTSSPVRMLRNEELESCSVRGLIPCGEGAGYAGGIMSAAVDGIRAAEKIMRVYKPR